jgi:hypothetical protein
MTSLEDTRAHHERSIEYENSILVKSDIGSGRHSTTSISPAG